MKEVWKDVKGYEGFYKVSNLGNVKRVEHSDSYGHIYRERILKPSKQSEKGYKHVHLSKNGITKWLGVHRLVAEAFLDNPNNYNVVNHIDNNPSNNSAENLEWTTYKGNMQHASKQGRMKSNPDNLKKAQESRKTPVIAIKGEDRILFDSQTEAAMQLGINRSHIAECCRGEYGYKTIGGYRFEYADPQLQASQKPNKAKMEENERKEFQRNIMLGNKIMLGRKLKEETKEKLRRTNVKPVMQYERNGDFVGEYFSAQEAKRVTGISHINECCKGRRKTAGNYIWRYKNE